MHRFVFRTAVLGLAALVFSAGALADNSIVIETNKSTSLRVEGGASSVVIGNPRIADVAVHNSNLLFITGRNFGSTNLLIFSESGDLLYSGDVVVTTNTTNLLNVNRAGETNTYDCAPTCRSVLAVGDELTYFDTLISQSLRLQELSEADN
ncbi:MAG: pilus assembly protein N-terminal domain-containing protein [Hyphomonadaceae bacterium]